MDISPSKALMLYPVLARKAHQEIVARNPGILDAAERKNRERIRSYLNAGRAASTVDIVV